MSQSNAFETALLNHIFKNIAIANIGDATGLPAAATGGYLYVGLHTANPDEAGDQTSSEATYTGYARIPIARGTGFTVTGNSVSNAAVVTGTRCTAGSNVITHFSIGTSASGAGTILYYSALTASLTISNGITPEIEAGGITVTLD